MLRTRSRWIKDRGGEKGSRPPIMRGEDTLTGDGFRQSAGVFYFAALVKPTTRAAVQSLDIWR